MIHAHSHDTGATGTAHLHTEEGLRAARIATAGLLLTGALELAVFILFARSAAVLADAFHNLGDVSTTIAIWIAFSFSRRAASDRYPYGLHRAEDLAGLFVLLAMAVSALVAGWESLRALTSGDRPDNLLIGMAAALIGAAGNEAVAQYKITVGRRIRSVSLQADGQHSRQDGLISLAALAGLLGVAAGLDWADGAAGLLITGVLVLVLISSARGILGRALDQVEPDLIGRIATVSAAVPAVAGVHDVRARWAGRALFAAVTIELPETVSLAEAHAAAEQVRHALLHEIDGLTDVDIHMDPSATDRDHHQSTSHHFGPAAPAHDHDEHEHDNGDDHHDHDPNPDGHTHNAHPATARTGEDAH